jgi:hypothetical protein
VHNLKKENNLVSNIVIINTRTIREAVKETLYSDKRGDSIVVRLDDGEYDQDLVSEASKLSKKLFKQAAKIKQTTKE